MLGCNERREAENLLKLLHASEDMRRRFNAEDEQITAALGMEASAEEALLRWYLTLVLEMEQYRLSGCYSLCFSSARRVRRHPYDLLARLPVTDAETEQAEIPEELLTGLAAEEREDVRRKYARLLRIAPMRALFERLSGLTAPLRQKTLAEPDVVRKRLLGLLKDAGWRRPIPAQEEYGRATLDVADNHFSIIDRLIENHRKPLSEKETVALPAAQLSRTGSASVHLTAAIVSCTLPPDALTKEEALSDFVAIPGGHTALGLYGEGTPESFFQSVQEDQQAKGQHERIIHTRRYCRFQLVRFSQRDVRALRRVQADMSQSCESVGVPQVPEAPADWYAVAQRIHDLPAAEASLGEQKADRLCLPDNGGNAAFRTLEKHFAFQRDSMKKTNKADAPPVMTALLRDFFAGVSLTDAKLAQAMRALAEVLAAYFAAGPCIHAEKGAAVKPIAYASKTWAQAAMTLVLAYLCREKGLELRWKPGTMPEPVAALLTGNAAQCRAFQSFCCHKQPEGAAMMLFTRQAAGVGEYCLLLGSCPRYMDGPLNDWFAGEGAGDGFAPGRFRDYCLCGTVRHVFRDTNVAPDKPVPFRFAPTPRIIAVDKAFQLVCLFFLMEKAKAARCELVREPLAPEQSVLRCGAVCASVMEVCGQFLALSDAARAAFLDRVKQTCLTIRVSGVLDNPDEIWIHTP